MKFLGQVLVTYITIQGNTLLHRDINNHSRLNNKRMLALATFHIYCKIHMFFI